MSGKRDNLLIIVVLIVISIVVRLTLHKLWINSEPTPFTLSNLTPTMPEHFILAGQKLDINRASENELKILPGIGEKLAEKVVEKRCVLGRFSSIEDILSVSGIGRAKLEQIRHYIDVK